MNDKIARRSIVEARETDTYVNGYVFSTLSTHTSQISSLLSYDSSNTVEIGKINNRIAAIASVLGITFNADGTLNTESYSTHTHNYDDDGVTETTTGVN